MDRRSRYEEHRRNGKDHYHRDNNSYDNPGYHRDGNDIYRPTDYRQRNCQLTKD
ncbi:Hypothetical predicted protein [Mytilus galloprovincialis]|uniref:Uncharacterized protein n=1 Tax=Mytilus galloprovincialis TaxID=29158 RepID=A0A8B6EHT0_MYTGA|nr:Hypothetical predicted protein [Mytilus galloprovincialis]